MEDVTFFIGRIRTSYPEIVFLLYPVNDESFQSWIDGTSNEWQSRLQHYYLLCGKTATEDDQSFDLRTKDAMALMREYVSHSTPNWRDLIYGDTTKVFVSSTAYDLRDLRSVIYATLAKSDEFFPIMSDRGSLVVDSRAHSYDNCLAEVEECDLFILIIAGRFGGEYGDENISITQKEYRVARSRGKPILTFVQSDVLVAKELLKPYFKDGVPFKPSKIVEDERIFSFIDEVRRQDTGNWIFSYHDAAHLMEILQVQIGVQTGEAAGLP